MGTYSGFFEGVLQKLNAPVSANNLNFFNQWAKYEKSNSQYNTLNTTLNKPGATNFNSVGVKNYPNLETGIQATADTLKLKYYKPIVYALQNNKAYSYYQGNQDIIKALNTWGTRTFARTLNVMPSPGSTNGTTTLPTEAPTVPTDGKKKINWLPFAIGGAGLILLGFFLFKKRKNEK